eukprot:4082013-Amphidinium_carterae.1
MWTLILISKCGNPHPESSRRNGNESSVGTGFASHVVRGLEFGAPEEPRESSIVGTRTCQLANMPNVVRTARHVSKKRCFEMEVHTMAKGLQVAYNNWYGSFDAINFG